jgi:hypothetical protein
VTVFVNAMREGGPWFVLLFVVLSGITGLLFAFSRGILVRGGEVERIERRIEKDTDRVLALWKEQISLLQSSLVRKDETIRTLQDQNTKLIESNRIATQALDKIVQEAEKRGIF